MTLIIPLTKGFETIIDDIDADLAILKWQAKENRKNSGRFYAVRAYYNRAHTKMRYMHRIILERMLGGELERGEVVDHIDNNPLNNCRSNLRVATLSQNEWNRKCSSNNTSGYKGVYWNERDKNWFAKCSKHGVQHYGGFYNTPELAYEAYKKLAREVHGEFANFGDTPSE